MGSAVFFTMLCGKQVNLLRKIFTYMLFVMIGIAIGFAISLTTYYVSGNTLFANLLGSRAKPETVSRSMPTQQTPS
jgi:hypothetical protein